ncbi:MAG: ABC transporter permease [Armatimonadota bacterium]
MTSSNTKTKKSESLSLPLKTAVHIALQSVRQRFGRTVITAAGTVLGIAFFVSVKTAGMIQANAGGTIDASEKVRMTWLTAMSLIVCLVGIINAMLMSVTERYQEIGTMKCLGAYDGFIVQLFFIESMMTGLLSSVIGWILGFGSVVVIRMFSTGMKVFHYMDVPSSLLLLGIALAIGTILSVLATIAPAYVASKMPAAAALRVEI